MRASLIEVEGKKLFVLNGLLACESDPATKIEALDELIEAIKRDPDAVAFGRTAGKWVAAA